MVFAIFRHWRSIDLWECITLELSSVKLYILNFLAVYIPVPFLGMGMMRGGKETQSFELS